MDVCAQVTLLIAFLKQDGSHTPPTENMLCKISSLMLRRSAHHDKIKHVLFMMVHTDTLNLTHTCMCMQDYVMSSLHHDTSFMMVHTDTLNLAHTCMCMQACVMSSLHHDTIKEW